MASRQGTGGKESNPSLLDIIKMAHFRNNKRKKVYMETRCKLEKIIKKTSLTQIDKEDATSLLQTLEDILNGEDERDMSIKEAKTAIEALRIKFGIEKMTRTERWLLPGIVGPGLRQPLDPESAWLVFRISLFRRWLAEDIPIPKGELEKDCRPALLDAQGSLIYMKGEMERRFGVIRKIKRDNTDCLRELLEFTKHPSPELDNEKGKDNYDPDDEIIAKIKQLLWNRHKELLDIEEKLNRLAGSEGTTKHQKNQEENIISRIQQLISQLGGPQTNQKPREDTIAQTSEEMRSFQKQLKALNKEIKDNKYDDKAFKKLQTKHYVKKKCSLKRSMENKDMKEHIAKLRKGVKEKKIDKIQVSADNQWKKDMNEAVDEIDKIVKEVNRLHEENSSLARDNKNMNDDINAIQKQLEQLESEKTELTLRLSNIAGAKLTERKPDFADLSDPYRPTKLSEQYMEIYDNEWTNAYDAMEKGSKLNEQQICLELLKILLKAESECREIAATQYEQLCCRCTNPAEPGEKGELDSIHLKLINDLQKQTARLSVSNVQKKILGKEKVSESSDVIKYQMKCVEVCWYMSLQTPPVILDKPLKEGQVFDRDKYREYTRKGRLVEFVIWPTLLLHKDGPLLCKGVAQGISRLS